MEELNKIIESDQEDLLTSIDNFQSEIIRLFLTATSNDYLASADNWLNASTANTAKFGGEQNKSKIYREKLLEELEKFLCGDKQYEDDRQKIIESTDNSKKYIILVISNAIGKKLGVAGTFIAPVIVLLILSIGKMAINAWCSMRKETRKSTAGNSGIA